MFTKLTKPMKILKRILLILLIVIIAAAVGGYFYSRYLATKGLPDYDSNVQLTGITEEVSVLRDARGVPHIYAKNEADLYVATGYVMAQDRLWQMDLLRRVTQGRLSEIFGEDMVNTDLLMRALRISEKSERIYKSSDKKLVAACENFASGVNQYIETHRDKLPLEFSILGYKPEVWQPQHSLNLVGYMAWDLAMAWNAEILLYQIMQKTGMEKFTFLIPDLKEQETPIYPAFELAADSGRISEIEIRNDLDATAQILDEMGLTVFNGSNNWAVSGEKSVTGKPILANDMHLGLFAPGIWMQMHQVIEDEMNITGLALPGQPFIIAGHNEHIAWGMTNVMIDDMDFYEETVRPEHPNQYLFNGEWRNMEVHTEAIITKEGNTVTKELQFTHRGPIVSEFHDENEKVISMRWTGNDYSHEAWAVYQLNRARNWDDFRTAVKDFRSVSQNIAYADVNGNIGLYCCAAMPIRKGNGLTIQSGETDEFDWQGIVPFEELPHTYNPPEGMVSSANNKTVGEGYPHYISYWFDLPYRIDRIREMLTEKEKLTVADFQNIQTDFKAKMAEGLVPEIVAELQKNDGWNEYEMQALNLLASWDYVMSPESAAASVFEVFYINFTKNLTYDELGDTLYTGFIKNKILVRNLIENVWRNKGTSWCDNQLTTETKETFADMVVKSFRETVQFLTEEAGKSPENWQWGKLHTITLKHPMGKVKLLDFVFNLNKGPYAVGGSFHTVSPYAYSFTNLFHATHGASHRHIYSAANWDESLVVIPTGTSGIPASPHYCDQTKNYITGKYYTDYFSRSIVGKNTQYTMKITGKE